MWSRKRDRSRDMSPTNMSHPKAPKPPREPRRDVAAEVGISSEDALLLIDLCPVFQQKNSKGRSCKNGANCPFIHVNKSGKTLYPTVGLSLAKQKRDNPAVGPVISVAESHVDPVLGLTAYLLEHKSPLVVERMMRRDGNLIFIFKEYSASLEVSEIAEQEVVMVRYENGTRPLHKSHGVKLPKLFLHGVKHSAWSSVLEILAGGFQHGAYSIPYGVYSVDVGRQAHLVKSYDGGAAIVFEQTGFPVDITSKKQVQKNEWIANEKGGALPGVCMHRLMPSKMHEYIHHRDSVRIRYVSVKEGLVKAWLRDEFVVQPKGREAIQDANRFRQLMHGKINLPELKPSSTQNSVEADQSGIADLIAVNPARPTPLEARFLRRGSVDAYKNAWDDAHSVNLKPVGNAGATRGGVEWKPTNDVGIASLSFKQEAEDAVAPASATDGGVDYGTGTTIYNHMKADAEVRATTFDVPAMWKTAMEPQTVFSEVSNKQPDRRGFILGAIYYHSTNRGRNVYEELNIPTFDPSESSSSSSRALASQVLPLVLESNRELTDRISSDLDRTIWRCAGTKCGIELTGRNQHDYFKENKLYYCRTCWHSRSNNVTLWRCAATNCGIELTGRNQEDYFKENKLLYCRSCWHSKSNNVTDTCSSATCGKPLTGTRAKDWFRHYGGKYCKACYDKM